MVTVALVLCSESPAHLWSVLVFVDGCLPRLRGADVRYCLFCLLVLLLATLWVTMGEAEHGTGGQVWLRLYTPCLVSFVGWWSSRLRI